METYTERVNQFVVEYHEDLPEEHKAQYRLRGIDPNDLWTLSWSFETLAEAEKQAAISQQRHDDFCTSYEYDRFKTFRVRDLGAPVEIQRSSWF